VELILTAPQFLTEVFASKMRMERKLASNQQAAFVKRGRFVQNRKDVSSQVNLKHQFYGN
jgi:hypothetical protein